MSHPEYEKYAERITQQIFEYDNAFFLESGARMEAGVVLKIHGTYGGIRYPVKGHKTITDLEIILEASDLYTVIVKKTETLSNVISIQTKKPVEIHSGLNEIKVERVFVFDLIEVLHSLFYRDGEK